MSEININIGADAKGAVDGFNQTADAAENASKQTENLSDSLEKQEKRIKALDGAINLVGGSVEVLAGGLALTGALSEEQAQKFESAAVGAIAFADGTKRILDGYKSLTESTKIATVAQKAFGIATKIALGPIGLAIAAFGAITAAVVLLKDKLEIANKVFTFFSGLVNKVANALGLGKSEAEKFRESQAALAEETDFALKLLQAQGASTDELVKKERELLNQRINSFAEGTEERKKAEQDLQLFEARVAKQRRDAQIQAAKEAKERREKEAQARKDEIQDLFDFYLRMIKDARKKTKELEDEFVKSLEKDNQKAFDENTKRMEARMKQSTQMIKSTGETAQKSTVEVASANLFAYAELAELAVGDSVEAFGQLFTALADVTGEGNEEAFEKSKKFKIAEVITSAIQASFQAFGAAQQFGPVLGPILGAAQVAAIAVASNKAIQDIRNSTFESSTTPSTSVSAGGGGVPRNGTLTTGGANPFGNTGFSAPQTTQPTAMRAYVLAGDVTDGQEANARISRRRSLGG